MISTCFQIQVYEKKTSIKKNRKEKIVLTVILLKLSALAMMVFFRPYTRKLPLLTILGLFFSRQRSTEFWKKSGKKVGDFFLRTFCLP